jgi:MFS family permease
MDILYVAAIGSLLTVINNDIGPQSSYSWIVTSFAIGSATVTVSPLVGRLGDIFGRRLFILLGNVFSGVGGIVGATATSINTLIGAGCLIGVGVALHQLSFASVSEPVPKRSRGISLGVMEGALAPVITFATLIGYRLAEHRSWRDIYWIIFAVNAGSFVLIFFYYRPMNQYIKEEGRTRFQQVQHLDWVGFLLFLAGWCCSYWVTLLVAISSHGKQ